MANPTTTARLNVRRVTLDAVLVESAAAAGADVRTGTAATGLLREHGRVCGVRTAAGDIRGAVENWRKIMPYHFPAYG